MTGDDGVLLWLTALIPAFLLAYYKGWRGVSVALAAGMAVLTSVNVALLLLGSSEPDWSLLLGVVVVYVGVCLGLGTFANLLHRARQDAERLALTDHLTALPNRRYAILVLERAFAAALRGAAGGPFCVALFDIDNFRDFNDRYGHAVGDAVLKGLAGVLSRYTRDMDLSSRFGGEEFLSVLLAGGEEGALVFAERIRKSVKELELSWGPITVSCGVAAFSEQMGTMEELLGAADEALYAAKHGGRDRVVLAGARPVKSSAY
jgi:diguanylate cyclase (GGDEF)-like protein